jgi:phage baseplate assembly protein W
MSFDFRINKGDIALGSDGDLDKVFDTEKLIQDVLKILSTPLGGNKFFSWYGSPLTDASIGQVADRKFINTMVNQIIRSNLETLQKLQKQQAASGQRVTAAELIAAVQGVSVNRNIVDPTFWRVVAVVLSKDLKTNTAYLDVEL